MKNRLQVVVVAAALAVVLTLAGPTRLLAHHSFAAKFDPGKTVKLTGTVTEMEWINPHSWIHIDVKGTDGKVVSWMVEGGSPNALLRRGFKKAALPAGTEIVIEGYQAKDGSNRANGRDITFADGKELFLGSEKTGAPDEK